MTALGTSCWPCLGGGWAPSPPLEWTGHTGLSRPLSDRRSTHSRPSKNELQDLSGLFRERSFAQPVRPTCGLLVTSVAAHRACPRGKNRDGGGDGVRMASQALPGFLCELPWEQKAEWTVRERDRERKVFLCRWFTLQWPPRPARCGRRTALIRWQESGARGKTRGKRLPLPADPAPLKATPQPSRPAPPFWQTNGTRHESRGLLSGEKHRADAGSAAMECLEERQVLGAARQGAWCRLGARQCREGAGTVDPAMGWGSGCAGSRRHRPAVSPDPPPPSSPPSPRSPLPSHPTLSLNGCKVRGRRGGGTLVTTSKSARSRTGLGYGGT
nr:uncharacterized protein LOC127483847 isoform X3 [Oryctolagus cuniculus]XP_051678958.1 uncharacterized protein LOC127483847 isoform X3 [Oryctolagus cuniculus]XP_051678959.1 uncharacterized protein LOC127483847 isoform X3 [Oryctolagus cuniculus]XP_051678960.1 uncharacterized protein LOC127483847 isoform X3 [Oryctolagus cuniculus]XP_051678961.1 uncharacterized protein LOC127483847 isoform X3 [Oryctolagus cuniculus]